MWKSISLNFLLYLLLTVLIGVSHGKGSANHAVPITSPVSVRIMSTRTPNSHTSDSVTDLSRASLCWRTNSSSVGAPSTGGSNGGVGAATPDGGGLCLRLAWRALGGLFGILRRAIYGLVIGKPIGIARHFSDGAHHR
jgi:hypothetical protein